MVPLEANGLEMDLHLWKAHGFVVEGQTFMTPFGRKGSARLLLFINSAHMGNYDEAIAETHPPDIVATRRYGRTKAGFAISADQELTDSLGAFFRLSWNDGQNETWAFTEIDRSLALGIVQTARPGSAQNDDLGVALVANGISSPHRGYLAAGGYGFIIGDGALDYCLRRDRRSLLPSCADRSGCFYRRLPIHPSSRLQHRTRTGERIRRASSHRVLRW